MSKIQDRAYVTLYVRYLKLLSLSPVLVTSITSSLLPAPYCRSRLLFSRASAKCRASESGTTRPVRAQPIAEPRM